jgi:chromosomal replication initiator protein
MILAAEHVSDPEVRINSHEAEAPKAPVIPVKYLTNADKIEFIFWMITEVTGVGRKLMEAKDRRREYVVARHMCMWFIEKYSLTESLKATGTLFGERDHSTVIHAKQAINDRVDTDKKFRHFFTLLKLKIEIQIL